MAKTITEIITTGSIDILFAKSTTTGDSSTPIMDKAWTEPAAVDWIWILNVSTYMQANKE